MCVPGMQFKMLHSSQVSREEWSSSSVPWRVLQQCKGLAVALMEVSGWQMKLTLLVACSANGAGRHTAGKAKCCFTSWPEHKPEVSVLHSA